jgi:hypothetical protein
MAQMLIGGEWVGSRSGNSIEVINPATGEPVDTAPQFGLRTWTISKQRSTGFKPETCGLIRCTTDTMNCHLEV